MMLDDTYVETLSLGKIMDLEPGNRKAIALAEHGLFYDGGHYKQWFLEQVLLALGIDVDALDAKWIQDEEYGSFERGISP